MIDEVRFFLKEIAGPNLGPRGLNQAQNEVICRFFEFGSYVFLECIYNENFPQYLTSSRGKTQAKKFGVQIWTKGFFTPKLALGTMPNY